MSQNLKFGTQEDLAEILAAQGECSPDFRKANADIYAGMDCLEQGRAHGFRLMQFNAVVASNIHAIHLYERLGFIRLGTVPGGFRLKDGSYEDIILFYHTL